MTFSRRNQTNPSLLGRLWCQFKQTNKKKQLINGTLCQIQKKGHLWKMIIKILHLYILLTMKRESALINISTRLSYTDYTQQLF